MKFNVANVMSLNELIHQNHESYNYHTSHIRLARDYALVINEKLGNLYDNDKLELAALSHDLMKETYFNKQQSIQIDADHIIPCDLNRYVRENLEVLALYGLDDYFNTDVQLHALSAGILLHEVMGVEDPEILYPVFFHSCPVIDVFTTLDPVVQGMSELMGLADKLSSNYLRINYAKVKVRVDLDNVVFGPDGNEFNYSLGLFVARLISQGHSTEAQSVAAADFYYKRLQQINPFIYGRYSVNKLGENKLFPERPSKALERSVILGDEEGEQSNRLFQRSYIDSLWSK